MFKDVRQPIRGIMRGEKPRAEKLVRVRAPMEQNRELKSLMTIDLNNSLPSWAWRAPLKNEIFMKR
jgi:hypothetical protein